MCLRQVREAVARDPDIVKQVDGVVHFTIGRDVSFVVDLKHGDGSVTRVRQRRPPHNHACLSCP